MLSHVEMARVRASGFKLFGKVITQCAERPQEEASAASPVFVAREEEELAAASERRVRLQGERGQVTAIKREAADDLDERRQGGEVESGEGQQPTRLQETAEARAAAAAPLPCPRCRSRDTKFCYFNNYNINQPRHFCKACHRYWTAGGALRNVPVGAGRRKNRPLGPVAVHHQRAVMGYILGFPNPSSPTCPSPLYADLWQVGPDRRF